MYCSCYKIWEIYRFGQEVYLQRQGIGKRTFSVLQIVQNRLTQQDDYGAIRGLNDSRTLQLAAYFARTPWGAGCKDYSSKGDTSYQCTMEVLPRPSQNHAASLTYLLNPTGRITETCRAGQVELGTHYHRCYLLLDISGPLQAGGGSSLFEREGRRPIFRGDRQELQYLVAVHTMPSG